MTRLEKMLKALGWQGGTIWQVQDELTKMGLTGWEVLELAPSTFEHLLELVEKKIAQQKTHVHVPWRGRGGDVGKCIYCSKKV